MIFGLERSNNKIYDRIVLELMDGLCAFGHHCMVVQPSAINSTASFYNAFEKCDWVIATNNKSLWVQKLGDTYFFEKFPANIIFLHHDALSHLSNEYHDILEKVNALIRIKNRSIHFTIEKGDEIALRDLGIACYSINHINTLGKPFIGATQQSLKPVVSFIGHAMPPEKGVFTFGFDDIHYYASYQSRMNNFAHHIRDDFAATQPGTGKSLNAETLSARIQYLLFTNYYTMYLRGEVLQGLKGCEVDLYGGDPAWMHDVERKMIFSSAHIANKDPVFDRNEVANIFHGSAINLNITSLQFDSAVINRVMDCVAAGGFILTDKKDQLFELSSCAKEISYSTLDELNDKIGFYLDPVNRPKKREIIAQLSADFAAKCSVEQTIARILGGIKARFP